MWPCNSISIALVWFVTHGKLTLNFKCGYFRGFFKVSYPCSLKSNSIPLDEIPKGMCELLPTHKLATSVLMDEWTWGQWRCPLWLHAARNGTPSPMEWIGSDTEDPRKCLPVKRSCSVIIVCWWSSRFLPGDSSLRCKDDLTSSSTTRAPRAVYVPLLTWGWKMSTPALWTQTVLMLFHRHPNQALRGSLPEAC